MTIRLPTEREHRLWLLAANLLRIARPIVGRSGLKRIILPGVGRLEHGPTGALRVVVTEARALHPNDGHRKREPDETELMFLRKVARLLAVAQPEVDSSWGLVRMTFTNGLVLRRAPSGEVVVVEPERYTFSVRQESTVADIESYLVGHDDDRTTLPSPKIVKSFEIGEQRVEPWISVGRSMMSDAAKSSQHNDDGFLASKLGAVFYRRSGTRERRIRERAARQRDSFGHPVVHDRWTGERIAFGRVGTGGPVIDLRGAQQATLKQAVIDGEKQHERVLGHTVVDATGELRSQSLEEREAARRHVERRLEGR